MLTFLISILRHPVTILGELVPHERFSETSGIIASNKIFLFIAGFHDERE